MYLSSTRYDKIQDSAVRILRKLPVLTFPIDLNAVIMTIPNLELRYYSELLGNSMMLFKCYSEDGFSDYQNDNRCIIWVNDQIQIERLRYTIAHEIAHFVLGHYFKDNISDEEKESEAQFFAAKLLASNWAIDRLSIITPWYMSYAFEISYDCAMYRFNNYKKWCKKGKPMTEQEVKLLKKCNFKATPLLHFMNASLITNEICP